MMLYPTAPEAATRFLHFVNASPTPFHAVHNAALRLEKAGFRKVKELDDWEKGLTAGGKYYFTRNQSALLAFTLPASWQPGAGVSIVATHIDSPNLRVRPVSKRSKAGYLQVGVETYGGGLWHTWFDRDLSLAGRVVVGKDGEYKSRLVKIDRPVLRIPNLAVHLNRNSADNFQFNTETEFVPVLGLIASELNATAAEKEKQDTHKVEGSSIQTNHHSSLLELLASELDITPDQIQDFEMHLYDTQAAVLGGLNNEFIFSPRMDNQFSSFCAVEALADHASSSNFASLEGNVNCIALFNHEEIGSVSTTGADGNLIPSLLERLAGSPSLLGRSTARSFLVSSDMGHAVHPNYLSKHEDNHRPLVNGGVVIKTNAKQRYASDAPGSFIVRKLIEKAGGRVQEYEVRNDMACGSTVGPMLSKNGLRTVDVGGAMLSMHSIRETAGSHDVKSMIDFFASFFNEFSKMDAALNID